MTARAPLFVLGVAATLAGCGDDLVPASVFGQQLFSDPKLSSAPANAYSCATCHAATPADPSRLDSGYSLNDSAFRGSWWGGKEIEYLDSVNFCLRSFMDAEVPLTADDAKSKALYEYLASISADNPATPMPLTVVKYIVEVPRGDPAHGQDVWTASCARCHGDYGTGDGRLTPSTPILPQVFASYPTKYPGLSPAQLVIEKIRHGNFFAIGGTMPPYSQEALSDADEGALLAYFQL